MSKYTIKCQRHQKQQKKKIELSKLRYSKSIRNSIQCTTYSEDYITVSKKIKKPTILKIGTFTLPAGIETANAIMLEILQYLDTRSLINLKLSSLIKQLTEESQSEHFECVREDALNLDFEGKRNINEMILKQGKKKLVAFIKRYPIELSPTQTQYHSGFPVARKTFIAACQYGHMDDVQLFVNLYPFQKYINDNMTLKEMVNQFDSNGAWTPLMIAANKGHFQIVQYLIELGADPYLTDHHGWNALYCSLSGKLNPDLIQFLLNYISVDNIKKEKKILSNPAVESKWLEPDDIEFIDYTVAPYPVDVVCRPPEVPLNGYSGELQIPWRIVKQFKTFSANFDRFRQIVQVVDLIISKNWELGLIETDSEMEYIVQKIHDHFDWFYDTFVYFEND
jgi:hypothetical protein